MSDLFVAFPGTAGNYVSTDDINKLDSDTAHLVQSIGRWTPGTLDAEPGWWEPDHAQSLLIAPGSQPSQAPGDYFDVTPDEQYTFSAMLKLSDVASNCRVKIWWYLDNGGGVIGSTNGDYAFTTDGWAAYKVTGVCPSGANTARCTIENGAEGSTFASAFCLREGTDPTFVPSLRIVGNLDVTADAAADVWQIASDQTLFDSISGGVGWRMFVDTSGQMRLQAYGTTGLIDEDTAGFVFVDGQRTSIRVTLDVSAGDMSWIQDGSEVGTDVFTPQPLAPAVVPLFVGQRQDTTRPFPGSMWSATVRDGIDGPVTARFDAVDVP